MSTNKPSIRSVVLKIAPCIFRKTHFELQLKGALDNFNIILPLFKTKEIFISFNRRVGL